MAKHPNIRYEKFAREYVLNGGNAADACRKTREFFGDRPLTNVGSARVIGFSMLRQPKVGQRIDELREKMAKKADITMDKVLTDLQEALTMARLHAKPSDMISASMAQAKLVGLLRDRVETGAVGDFDGIEDISEILEKVAKEEGPEAALALSKAFGLDQAETAVEQPAELMDQSPPTDAVN